MGPLALAPSAHAAAARIRTGQYSEVEEVLNAHLANRTYFLGYEFSALDVPIGGGLNFMMMAKMIAETQVLKAHTARITDRAIPGSTRGDGVRECHP